MISDGWAKISRDPGGDSPSPVSLQLGLDQRILKLHIQSHDLPGQVALAKICGCKIRQRRRPARRSLVIKIRERNALRAHRILRDGSGGDILSEDGFQVCKSSDNPGRSLEIEGYVVGEHLIEGGEIWNPGDGAGIRDDSEVGKTFLDVEDVSRGTKGWKGKREQRERKY